MKTLNHDETPSRGTDGAQVTVLYPTPADIHPARQIALEVELAWAMHRKDAA